MPDLRGHRHPPDLRRRGAIVRLRLCCWRCSGPIDPSPVGTVCERCAGAETDEARAEREALVARLVEASRG